MPFNKSHGLWIGSVLLLIAGTIFWYLTDDSLQHKVLPDGAEVFYFRGSSFDVASNYSSTRLIEAVDGDFFFRTPATEKPLILHTQLLEITVTGASAFRVTAHADKTGERVDVLYGHVHTEKRYKSPMQEPVDMVGGQMMMINITIDFVEKEVLHDDEVAEWILALEPNGIQRPTDNKKGL